MESANSRISSWFDRASRRWRKMRSDPQAIARKCRQWKRFCISADTCSGSRQFVFWFPEDMTDCHSVLQASSSRQFNVRDPDLFLPFPCLSCPHPHGSSLRIHPQRHQDFPPSRTRTYATVDGGLRPAEAHENHEYFRPRLVGIIYTAVGL